MKQTILVMLLAAFYVAGHAQAGGTTGGKFSIGLEAGKPIGEVGKFYSHLLGGSLQYEMKPDSDIGITVNGGYQNYSIKSSNGGGSVGFVPLLAGVKYYFVPAAFFHAQLGAAFGTDKGQGTSFTYSPGIGFNLSRNFDATLKYTGISNKGGNLDNVGLRIGYNF